MDKYTAKERNQRRYEAYAQYRDALGLTDYYISKQAGISQSTLSDWKSGRYCPGADNLLKICQVVAMPLEKLLID